MICKTGEAMNYTVKDFDIPVCEECMGGYKQLNSAEKMLLGCLGK